MQRSEKIPREVVEAMAYWLPCSAPKQAARRILLDVLPALRKWLGKPDPLRDAVVEAALLWGTPTATTEEFHARENALEAALAALANRAGR